jgi:hypothetical protein
LSDTTLPPWLLRLADKPNWDHTLRAPDVWRGMWAAAQADAARWTQPNLARRLSRARDQFMRMPAATERDLRAVRWQDVSSSRLVVLWQHTIVSELALRVAVPSVFARAERLWNFYELLLRGGVHLKSQNQIKHEVDFAFLMLVGQLSAPIVWTEIERRGGAHAPGFAAGMLRLCQSLRRTGWTDAGWIDFDAFEKAEDRAVETLATRVKRRLRRPQGSKHVMAESQSAVPLLSIEGQIPITTEACWGAFDPLRTLASALDGRLDIAPTAIVDDLRDEMKKIIRFEREQPRGDREDLEVLIAEADLDDPALQRHRRTRGAPGVARTAKARRTWRADAQQARAERVERQRAPVREIETRLGLVEGDVDVEVLLDEFLAVHPDRARDVEVVKQLAAGPHGTQKALAAKYGVTALTIRKWRDKLLKDLRLWRESHRQFIQ